MRYPPPALQKDEPLVWSTGTGTDVWSLFTAASRGDVATIRRLLDHDPSLVRAHYAYRPAIAFAVRENQLEAAALLLERGADPVNSGAYDTLVQMASDRGYGEMTALLQTAVMNRYGTPRGAPVAQAIRDRDLAKVRALLDADPELVHVPDESSNRPIHWAVMTRQLDVIDELLARGADLDVMRADGARPIQLSNGDYHYRGWRDVPEDVATTPRQILEHLRARGAFVDLCTAAYIGDEARVRALIDADPSVVNRPGDYVSYYACSGTPLRNAAAGGHRAIVELLLERGAHPNLPEEGIAPHGHALHAAVCNGHLDIVQLLLDHGAHANVEIESSADTLSAAILRKNQPMIDLLCAHGAARAVHLLAYYGDVPTAAAVFAANPALADDAEALGNAAGQGHEAFVRLMLRYRSDLPKQIATGVPPGKRALAELLFAHGMNPSHADWLGVTPLHHFARRGDLENAETFLDHGADLHARDDEYRATPLGYATKFGQKAMVELLLRRGARAGS